MISMSFVPAGQSAYFGVRAFISPKKLLDIVNARTKTLHPSVAFSRASTAMVRNQDGTWASVGINTPRWGYTDLGEAALHTEPQSTNLLAQNGGGTLSGTFYNAGTGISDPYVVVSSALGAFPSYKVTAASGSFVDYNAGNLAVTAGSAYTWSFYLKGRTPTFSNGSASPIRDATNNAFIAGLTVNSSPGPGGFTRYSVTFTAPAGCTTINPKYCYTTLTSGEVMEIAAMQLEAGTVASSPILTTGAQTTRAADLLTINNTVLGLADSGLTVVARFLARNTSSYPAVIGASSGATLMHFDGGGNAAAIYDKTNACTDTNKHSRGQMLTSVSSAGPAGISCRTGSNAEGTNAFDGTLVTATLTALAFSGETNYLGALKRQASAGECANLAMRTVF